LFHSTVSTSSTSAGWTTRRQMLARSSMLVLKVSVASTQRLFSQPRPTTSVSKWMPLGPMLDTGAPSALALGSCLNASALSAGVPGGITASLRMSASGGGFQPALGSSAGGASSAGASVGGVSADGSATAGSTAGSAGASAGRGSTAGGS